MMTPGQTQEVHGRQTHDASISKFGRPARTMRICGGSRPRAGTGPAGRIFPLLKSDLRFVRSARHRDETQALAVIDSLRQWRPPLRILKVPVDRTF